MKLAARTVWIALAPVALGAVVLVVGCSAPAEVKVPAYQPPARAQASDLKGLPVGMSGCLASACHGSPAQRTLEGKIDGLTWQSSGSCWSAADPHTAAYSLLTDTPHRPVKVTAKHIMARYAPGTTPGIANDISPVPPACASAAAGNPPAPADESRTVTRASAGAGAPSKTWRGGVTSRR